MNWHVGPKARPDKDNKKCHSVCVCGGGGSTGSKSKAPLVLSPACMLGNIRMFCNTITEK